MDIKEIQEITARAKELVSVGERLLEAQKQVQELEAEWERLSASMGIPCTTEAPPIVPKESLEIWIPRFLGRTGFSIHIGDMKQYFLPDYSQDEFRAAVDNLVRESKVELEDEGTRIRLLAPGVPQPATELLESQILAFLGKVGCPVYADIRGMQTYFPDCNLDKFKVAIDNLVRESKVKLDGAGMAVRLVTKVAPDQEAPNLTSDLARRIRSYIQSRGPLHTGALAQGFPHEPFSAVINTAIGLTFTGVLKILGEHEDTLYCLNGDIETPKNVKQKKLEAELSVFLKDKEAHQELPASHRELQDAFPRNYDIEVMEAMSALIKKAKEEYQVSSDPQELLVNRIRAMIRESKGAPIHWNALRCKLQIQHPAELNDALKALVDTDPKIKKGRKNTYYWEDSRKPDTLLEVKILEFLATSKNPIPWMTIKKKLQVQIKPLDDALANLLSSNKIVKGPHFTYSLSEGPIQPPKTHDQQLMDYMGTTAGRDVPLKEMAEALPGMYVAQTASHLALSHKLVRVRRGVYRMPPAAPSDVVTK